MATKEELMKQLALKGSGGTVSPTNIVIPRGHNPAYASMGDVDPHELEQMQEATWDVTGQQTVYSNPEVYYVLPERRFVLAKEARELLGGGKVDRGVEVDRDRKEIIPWRDWFMKFGKQFKTEKDARAAYDKEFGGGGGKPKYTPKEVIQIRDVKHMADIDSRQVIPYNEYIKANQVQTTETTTEEESFSKKDAESPDEWAHKLALAGVPEGTLFKFAGRIYKVKGGTQDRPADSEDPKHETYDDPYEVDKSDPVDF